MLPKCTQLTLCKLRPSFATVTRPEKRETIFWNICRFYFSWITCFNVNVRYWRHVQVTTVNDNQPCSFYCYVVLESPLQMKPVKLFNLANEHIFQMSNMYFCLLWGGPPKHSIWSWSCSGLCFAFFTPFMVRLVRPLLNPPRCLRLGRWPAAPVSPAVIVHWGWGLAKGHSRAGNIRNCQKIKNKNASRLCPNGPRLCAEWLGGRNTQFPVSFADDGIFEL